MGGYGSGQSRWRNLGDMEDYLKLDVRHLQRTGSLRPGVTGAWSWSRGGEPAGNIRFTVHTDKLVLDYRHKRMSEEWQDVRQTVWLTKTSCTYGGTRPWFLCPACGRRVAVLINTQGLFFCRHCCRLTYRSQNSTPLERAQRKVARINGRLGNQRKRQKGMHRKTYRKILEQLEAAEERENEFYRVVLFRIMRCTVPDAW